MLENRFSQCPSAVTELFYLGASASTKTALSLGEQPWGLLHALKQTHSGFCKQIYKLVWFPPQLVLTSLVFVLKTWKANGLDTHSQSKALLGVFILISKSKLHCNCILSGEDKSLFLC